MVETHTGNAQDEQHYFRWNEITKQRPGDSLATLVPQIVLGLDRLVLVDTTDFDGSFEDGRKLALFKSHPANFGDKENRTVLAYVTEYDPTADGSIRGNCVRGEEAYDSVVMQPGGFFIVGDNLINAHLTYMKTQLGDVVSDRQEMVSKMGILYLG